MQSGDWGWLSVGVLGSFAVSAIALAVFVRRSLHHTAPVIDLALFRDRSIAVANALTLVGSIGFYSLSLSTVIYLMTVWGYSPLTAGLAMTPAPFAGALAALAAGRWKGDPRPLLVLGSIVWAGGATWLVLDVGTEPAFLREWLPIACTMSIGLGLTFPTIAGLAVGEGEDARFASETAVNSAIRQLGAAIGVAVLVVALGTPTGAEVPGAFDRAWTVSAVLFALVGVASLAFGRRVTRPVLAPSERAPSPAGRAPGGDGDVAAGEPWRSPDVDAQDPLAETSVLGQLDPARRRALAAEADRVVLAAGEWLFHQGDAPDGLYVVLSGRLQVMREDGDGAEPLRELGRGAVLGELALLSGGARTAGVRARRDSELLRLALATFDELVAEPAVARRLLAAIGAQLERSRGEGLPEPAPPAMIAVVAAGADAPAPAVFDGLAAAIPTAARLRRGDVDHTDRSAALARALDRAERAHGRVLLLATAPPGDPWTDACIRQADRVVLVVRSTAPDPRRAPAGADVLLCGPAFDVGDIAPRTVHRADARHVTALARRLTGESVGLVLSGGGARAFGHIGVLQELEAAGVTVDRVAGASLGALIAAMHAAGMDADEIDARCYEEWVRRNPLGDYRVPRVSLIRGQRVLKMLERTLPARVEELWRPFLCVTTDLMSGELVIHRHGDLRRAVGASMCLPGLAPPVVMGRRLLVDGGVLDNLPVGALAALAEGPIIASKLNNSEAFAPDPDAPLQPPQLTETLYRLILLGAEDTAAVAGRHATLVITPDSTDVGMLEFHMLDRMREAGRRAAAAALETWRR